jgi:hypothetical protein
MTKLGVLVLYFSYFTDNSNVHVLIVDPLSYNDRCFLFLGELLHCAVWSKTKSAAKRIEDCFSKCTKIRSLNI